MTKIIKIMQEGRFCGYEPRLCGEHRTVGTYRAWCYDCNEWCYNDKEPIDWDLACKGCREGQAKATTGEPRLYVLGGLVAREIPLDWFWDRHRAGPTSRVVSGRESALEVAPGVFIAAHGYGDHAYPDPSPNPTFVGHDGKGVAFARGTLISVWDERGKLTLKRPMTEQELSEGVLGDLTDAEAEAFRKAVES